ncbi:MAG: RNA methyltransferase [Bacilli bacterium]
MVININSKDNKVIKYVNSLRNNNTMYEKRQFITEGEHLFLMALESKSIAFVVTLSKKDLPDSITQYIVTEDIMKKISINKSIPNVITICNFINSKTNDDRILFYLDNVQDPGNFGTIIRSAIAFNFKNILVSENTVNKYNEKCIQASQGGIFSINIERIDCKILKKYKDDGYKIVVSLLDKTALKLTDFIDNKKEKYIFVFGNEGQGVSKEVISLADFKLYIPISNIDSLNVGIATSIVMYELSQK